LKNFIIEIGMKRNISEIAHALEKWLKASDMDVCVFHLENGRYVVQARHRCGCIKMIGMDAALVVELEPVAKNYVSVTIGGGIWKDKLAAGAASVLFLWPLALTSACGAARQQLLIMRAERFIRDYAAN